MKRINCFRIVSSLFSVCGTVLEEQKVNRKK